MLDEHRNASPVSRDRVAKLLRALADDEGWPKDSTVLLGPHSLRGGGATAATMGGADELEVKALAGRWKSDAVRGYVEASHMRARKAQRAISKALAASAKAREATARITDRPPPQQDAASA